MQWIVFDYWLVKIYFVLRWNRLFSNNFLFEFIDSSKIWNLYPNKIRKKKENLLKLNLLSNDILYLVWHIIDHSHLLILQSFAMCKINTKKVYN